MPKKGGSMHFGSTLRGRNTGQGSKAKRKHHEGHKMTPEKLLEHAPLILRELEENSPFFQSNKVRQLPRMERSELGLGRLLGEGAFSRVEEIVAVKLRLRTVSGSSTYARSSPSLEEAEESSQASDILSDDVVDCGVIGERNEVKRNKDEVHFNECNKTNGVDRYQKQQNLNGNCQSKKQDKEPGDDDGDEDYDEDRSRQFMADNCLRENVNLRKDARYAIKRMLPNLSKSQRAKGIVDLAIESKFLAVLAHPNVVRMRAMGMGSSLSSDFFIVLDRLYGTLDDKIHVWKDDMRSFQGSCCGFVGSNKMELKQLWLDRLLVAYDLSSGIRYLHRNNIVYRDLKPENIGFDVRGDVKIFDFGLAKELRPEDRVDGDFYDITGRTGSLLYMAPEVALCRPYNLKADTYSYGLLLWEMCSLEQPFRFLSSREVYERVSVAGYRPLLQPSWSKTVKNLIKDCWDPLSSKRPSFELVSERLREDFMHSASGRSDAREITNRTSHLLDLSSRSRHDKSVERKS